MSQPGVENAEAPDRSDEGDRATGVTGRSLGTTFQTSVAAQVINTITGVVLARGLGVSGRGELAAAMLWSLVLGAIATLGLEESTTYHVARDPRGAGRILGSGLVLCAVQSVVFTSICAALIPLVLARHSEATVVSAFIYVLYIPINAVGVVLLAVLNGLLRYRWFNLGRLAVGVFILAAQAALLATHGLSVRTMVVAYILCYAATILLAVFLVARARPGRLSVDRPTMRSMFGYGVRSHASSTSSQLNQRLDQLLISAFLSARQLGLYVIAVTLTSATGLVGGSVAYVALPAVARLEPGPRRTLYARRLISLTLVVSAAIALPVLVLAPELVTLFFGADFRPAAGVTRILVVAVVAFSTSRAIEAVLRAIGRPLDAGIAEIVALGATVAGLAALLPLLGLIGAGLASLLSYVIADGWMLRRAAKALDVPAFELLRPDAEALRWARSRLRRRREPRSAP